MLKKFFVVLSILMIASMVLGACTTPTPQVIKETVVVKEEVSVEKTVVVEQTVEVESVVEQTVEVQVPSERTKVIFWHIFGDGPSRDAFDQLVSEFNLTNQFYIVEPVYAEFWTYEQKLLADIAAGTPPDVVMTDMTRAGQRAEANQVIPLDEYINADKFDLTVFWEYGQKDVVYKGQTWGIPYGPDTRVLYYNKAHFAEAGLDPNTPPTTWDELWDYAHKLDVGEGADITRVGFNPWWGNVWALPFIYTTGVELVDPEGPQFFFEDPKVLEAAQWYKQWVDYYGKENLDLFASGFGTGAQDAFMSGQTSMMIQTQGYIDNLLTYAPDLDWGIALIPYKYTPSSWGAGFDLEIPVGAKNPDGAWEFIKYLTSYDVAVKAALAAGWMPGRKDAAADPAFAAKPGWDVVLESMAVTRSRPFILEAPAWYGPLITAFQEVWDGVKTPEQALADAVDAVETEVENYRAQTQ